MSQLWIVDGKWLTIDQLRKLESDKAAEEKKSASKKEVVEEKEEKEVDSKEVPADEEKDEKSVDEPTEKEIEEKPVSVDDVLFSENIAENVNAGKFVESELEELSNRDLMDIIKKNDIKVTGIPNKKKMIELLLESNENE